LRTALLTTTTALNRDATWGLVRSFVGKNPGSQAYVVGREGSQIPDAAQLISIDSIQSQQGLPLVGTLHPEDAAAYCIPFALADLLSQTDRIFLMDVGLMVSQPLTAALDALRSCPVVVFQSVVSIDSSISTPALNRLEGDQGRLFDRAVAFAGGDQTVNGIVESWQIAMRETIVDPFMRKPSAVLRSLIESLGLASSAGIERSECVADLENFCLAGSSDSSSGLAVLIADDLWEIERPVLRRYDDDPEPAERRGNLLMQHRVHDPKPLESLDLEMRRAQAECAIDLSDDNPYDWFSRDVRRASDPLGLRWGPGEGAAFQDWMYESNDAGLTRAAHLYWYARSDLQEAFPDVTADPSLYRTWNDERAVKEFGVDLFDRASESENPEGSVGPVTEWLARRNRFANALAWRWTAGKALLPGHVARVERRHEASLASTLTEPKRVDMEARSLPFGRAPHDLTLMGLLRSNSGLGQAARSSFDALKSLNRSFSCFDTTDQYLSRNTSDPGLASVPMGAFGDVNLIHANAAEFSSRLGLFHHRLAGRYNVAMWFWEGARMPESYLPAFDTVDELWLASDYLADVFGQYGKVPVHVVGLAAELPERSESTRSAIGLADDEFIFLFVYDAQSVPVRKNPEKALEAFINAFGPSFVGVRFILKVHNLHKFPDSERRLRKIAARYDAVSIVDDYLPRRAMLDLMQNADVYVSLHAAEGFGLTLLESMALGTPVIATGFSGNMDFTSAENSWLVDYRLTALEEQVGPYPKGTVWADPDIDMAADAMRHAFHDRAELKRKSVVAELDATRIASLERYAERLDAQLRRIGV
jgi:glycosyltransferase involved in cell wall biosynthesis